RIHPRRAVAHGLGMSIDADALRQARPDRLRRPQYVRRPRHERGDQRSEVRQFLLALTTLPQVLHQQRGLLELRAPALVGRSAHDRRTCASAPRSFRKALRIRVLTVPSGSLSRCATSEYVNSPKNALSTASRSGGVRTASALSSRWRWLWRSTASSGSRTPSVGTLACGNGATRFLRLSKRSRSRARLRAWFKIQPRTGPVSAS